MYVVGHDWPNVRVASFPESLYLVPIAQPIIDKPQATDASCMALLKTYML